MLHDDLEWPILDTTGAPVVRKPSPQPSNIFSGDSSGSDLSGDDDNDDSTLKQYWNSLRRKYLTQAAGAENGEFPCTETLPAQWTVVHISVTDDRNTLLISRQRGGENVSPLVFSIPLKGRREVDEDEEHLTFDDALEQFAEIIRQSDASAKAAADVPRDDREARANWWKTRAALDTQLRELLGNIEFCWLGVFKVTINFAKVHLSPIELIICPDHS